MRSRTLSSTTLASLLLILLATCASAASAVLGIDVGQEYIKAALVKPGIPLEIVLTKDTKRKEASAIGFKPSNSPTKDGVFNHPERLYGADAVNLAGRFPHDVYPNLKQLLGKLASNEVATQYSGRYPAIEILPSEQNTIAFKSASSPKGGLFPVEELLAMQLKAVVRQAQVMAGSGAGKIRDVMFTVPAFFTAEEKHALTLAAELAGLKVMGFVSDGLAVGINYAISRTFDEQTPEFHIVYDMGAGSTTASVLRFQGKSVKDVGRFNKMVQEVSVLGVGYDSTLGGDLFNEKLVDLLVADFVASKKGQKALAGQTDPKNTIRTNGRAAAKLWREATRSRQILSANSDTIASIESLYDDVDFRSGKITRTAFEEAISEYEARITNPIFDALKNAKITLDQINSIIVHGGAVRTPFVGKKIEDVLGGPERISKNVNPDEAAVFGATFKGAGESGSFKVKEITTNDINLYPVSVRYAKSKAAGMETTQQIFPAGPWNGKEKVVGFPQKQEFSFSIVHNLPGRLEGVYTIQSGNLTESVKELQGSFGCAEKEISAKFALALDSKIALPKVTKGWVECEVEAPEKKDGIVDGVKGLFGFGKKDGEASSSETASPSGESSSSTTSSSSSLSSASPAPVSSSTSANPATETPKMVKKIERIPVAFTATEDGAPAMSKESKKDLIAEITSFDRHDNSRRKLEEVRNDLEAFTYKAREQLHDDLFVAASTEGVRAQLSGLLDEAGEWLYGDGFHATLDQVKQKFNVLKDVHTPIFKRKEENAKRPEQVKILRESVSQIKQLIQVLKDSASGPLPPASSDEELEDDATTTPSKAPKSTESVYTPEELATLTEGYEKVEKWLEDKIKEQEKLQPWQEPVLGTKDIEKKLQDINKIVVDVLQRKMKAAASMKAKSSSKTTTTSSTATASKEKETETKTHDEL
jgi:hypoxia up-regulated 1